LADTQRFLRTRSVADQPLWQNAAVRQRFARAVVDHQLLCALGDRLCRPAESTSDRSGDRVVAQAAVFKAAGAGTLERVLADCGELAGADGFRHGSIQDLRRETAMFGIAGGSTATMLDLITDHIATLLPEPRTEER
jgi:citronellyl-CoA dehydrogenase